MLPCRYEARSLLLSDRPGRAAHADAANRLQNLADAERIGFSRQNRLRPTAKDGGLGRQIVHLLRLELSQHPRQRHLIEHVALKEGQPALDLGDAVVGFRAWPPDETRHIVPFGQKEFGQVRSILPSDTSD